MSICIFAYVLDALPPPSCAARRRRVYLFNETTQFIGRADLVSPVCYRMTRSHVTAAVFQTRARFYDTITSDFVE